MTLFDRILEESQTLKDLEHHKTGKAPRVACYLGIKQRHELEAHFAQLEFMQMRRYGEPWPEDPEIAGCKIFYVLKADHYNVALLKP